MAVDERQDPRSLVEQNSYSWTFATTGDDLQALYGITGIPLTLFVNRKGEVSAKHMGGMDKATFEGYLAKIL